jgi:hypothetical protein
LFQASGEEVSVFIFDVRSGNDTQFDVAKTAVKRLKTLRHPSILPYLDGLEVNIRGIIVILLFVFILCNEIGFDFDWFSLFHSQIK